MTFPVEGGVYTAIFDDETFDDDGRPKRTGNINEYMYINGEPCV